MTCVFAAAAICSTAAVADDMYVNFGVGGLNVDTNEGRLLELIGDAGVDVTNVSFDTSSTTFFIRGGYEFNEYIAVEGLYQDYESTRTLLVGQVIDPDALPDILASGIPGSGDAYGASARFSLPLSKSWFIDARVGAMNWSSEKVLSFPDLDREVVQENSGTDPVYGLGMRFFVNYSFEIAAEYQYADFETKTESYSVVLGYRF
ncbi:porin family protein [uncultured Umboniibacter sp.]|uniref:porin family protein n=1 Tax=uncultured Umboniibacter sp. TaxID=1798917 RepID=UPI00262B7BC4|nr:porin family protein [uncultured Umboniibacter sp.]